MGALSCRISSSGKPPKSAAEAYAHGFGRSQQQYEGYVLAIDGKASELQLDPGENLRSVKVRLRRASTRLGKDLQIWESAGRVYFRLVTKHGRPRSPLRPLELAPAPTAWPG
jgi:hypothetical protein